MNKILFGVVLIMLYFSCKQEVKKEITEEVDISIEKTLWNSLKMKEFIPFQLVFIKMEKNIPVILANW